jgi:hypothetical protein
MWVNASNEFVLANGDSTNSIGFNTSGSRRLTVLNSGNIGYWDHKLQHHFCTVNGSLSSRCNHSERSSHSCERRIKCWADPPTLLHNVKDNLNAATVMVPVTLVSQQPQPTDVGSNLGDTFFSCCSVEVLLLGIYVFTYRSKWSPYGTTDSTLSAGTLFLALDEKILGMAQAGNGNLNAWANVRNSTLRLWYLDLKC